MTSAWLTTKATPLSREGEWTATRVMPISFSIARALLVATLFLAPLDFGAVEPWAWAMLAAMASLLLLLWAIGCVQRSTVRLHWSPLYVPAALFLALGLVQYVARLSLNPYATWESLIKLLTDLIFFFLAGQLWADASETACRRFGLVVSGYAFALSLFAIIQSLSSRGAIYWAVKIPRDPAFGPYVNHNHYAGLMEMLIPLGAASFLSLPNGSPGRALLGFAVLVPVASVFLSGSRGGFIALLVEIVLLGIFLRRDLPDLSRERLRMTVMFGIIGAALMFFWADPGGRISKHLATIADFPEAPDAVSGGRIPVWKDTLHMIRRNLWTGVGMGSFESAYPQYQSFSTDLVWNHAHNDYLEAAAETGLPGMILILAALGIFVQRVRARLKERAQAASGWLQAGAALGCCGLLVHSLSDFNLRIPANAAWFAVLLAIATENRGVQPGDLRRRETACSMGHGRAW